MINFNTDIFIRPPYRDCPMCKKVGVFGVLEIGGNAYTRKCMACKQTKEYHLPKLDKQIIYLDQFALSNMAKSLHPDTRGKVDPFWKDLFGKLDTLCKLQAIICPKSNFHDEESRMTTDHFEKIRRINLQLSNNISFINDEEIRRHQIFKFSDCWLNPNVSQETIQLERLAVFKEDPHGWQSRIIKNVDFPIIPVWSERLRQIRKEAGKDYNEVVMKRRWEEQKDKSSKVFFRHVAEEEASEFGRVVLKLAKDQIGLMAAVELGIIPAEEADIWPTPSFLLVQSLEKLFTQKGVPYNDLAKQVYGYLTSPLVAEIPFNKISGALYAATARKHCAGRKDQPGDKKPSILADISMISTLLPYCDAMMIDTECYLFLNEPDVQQYLDYDTRLFCKKNRDEFMDYLNQIEVNMTSEHRKVITSVYGKDWERPYYNIFERTK